MQKVFKNIVFTLLAVNIASYGSAQSITIVSNQTAATLANMIVGSGVSVSGATLSCNSKANGLFANINPTPTLSLAIDSGIVLSTGKVLTVTTTPRDTGINENRFVNASFYFNINTTDAQITSIAGSSSSATQHDLCYLLFNFVPRGDTTSLDYTFASEEYPDYNCTQFNDAFGIFVAPPSSSTYTNYAKVPNTNINVSVNSINNGSAASGGNYSAYCSSLGSGAPFTGLYVDNQVSNHIVYDGMTKTMKARFETFPGQTHTMKIAIADIADGWFDSGIFVKKGSFTSPILLAITGTKSTSGTTTNPLYLIEGCNPGTVSFTRSSSAKIDTVTVTYSGTASAADHNGTASFTIPVGSLTYNFNIQAILDNLVEGTESIKLVFSCPSRGLKDSVTFQIKDFANGISVFNSNNDTTVCNNRVVGLYSTNTDTVFKTLWTPAAGFSCTSCSNTNYTASNGNIFSTVVKYLRISAAGCADVDSALTINIQPKPVITLSTPFNLCKGDSVNLNATVSPASASYSISWASTSSLSSLSILNPIAKPPSTQTFKLYVSTSAGCKDSATTVVNVYNIANEIDSIVKTSASCGVNNGGIIIYTRTSAPFNPPYQYSINGGASYVTGNTFSSLAAGTYPVSIKNNVGCRFDTSITIASGATPPSASISVTNPTCGLNNGSAVITSKSGNAPLSFEWKLGATVVSTDTAIYNLTNANNTYILKVTDVNGCFTQYSVTISLSSAVSVTFTRSHPSCGLNNGSLVASPSSGSPGFTYLWNPTGSTSNSISGLSPGVYKITVTDSKGCVLVDSSQLFSFPAPVLSMTSTNALCGVNNGIATVNITSGGVSPFVYSWSIGSPSAPTTSTTNTIAGLSPGKYFISVLDSKNCLRVDSITITGSPALGVALTRVNASCGNNNGTITTTVGGGTPAFTYLWSDGATTLNRAGLGAGTYSVTVTDSKGCTATQTIGISMTSNPAVQLTKSDATCGRNNGVINSNVTGAVSPISYAWSNGKTTSFIDSLAPGTYTLTMTDNGGCQKTSSITIVGSPNVSFNSSITHPTCGGSNGSISITSVFGTAPIIFNWSDAVTSANRTSLSPGTYILYVSDSLGCNLTRTFIVNSSSVPAISDTVIHALCDSTKGKIILVVTNGKPAYKYSWTSGDTTRVLNSKAAGTYTVTVTDSLGCSSIFTDSIVRRANPTYSDSIAHPKCGPPNGFVTIYNVQGNGPYTYGWNPSNSTSAVNPTLGGGKVYLTLTDGYSCRILDTFDLVTNGALVGSYIETSPACGDSNGSVVATISGGNPPYKFNWSNGDKTNVADSLKHGTYYLTVTDSLGCIMSSTFRIKNITNLRANFNITQTRCDSNTGSITVTAVNGKAPYIYIWDYTDTVQTKTKLGTGAYNFTIIDSNKCIYDSLAFIKYTHYPKIIVDSVIPETCGMNNAKIYISIDSTVGNRRIKWNGTLDSVYFKTGLSGNATMYILVEDSLKCTTDATIDIPEVPLGNVSLSKKLGACGANDGSLTIVADFTVNTATWSNGKTNKDSISGLSPGTYRVTITDASLCQYVLVDTIKYSTPPTVTFAITKPNCGRGDGDIKSNVTTLHGGIIYEWKNQSGTLISDSWRVINVNAGNYTLKITDKEGCSINSNLTVVDSAGPKTNYQISHSNCIDGIGKIKAIPYSGSPPFSFRWSDLSTKDSIVNKYAGTYYCSVTDQRACVTTDTLNVLFRRKPQINLFPIQSKCGPNNGVINTTVVLGTSPYSYSWSSGDAVKDLTNKSAGKYVVTVTDSVGCKAIDSSVITAQPAVLAVFTKKDAFCDLNNGYITATIVSGKAPFSYSWDGSVSSLTYSNRDTGLFRFQLIDSNNCVFLDSMRIYRVKKHSITNSVINDNCTYCTGKIFSTVADGKVPYSFAWSNTSATVKDITGLCAGNVTLSVTDSLGCMVTKVLVVSDTSGPILSLVKTDPTCGIANGRMDAYVSSSNNPLSHFWNNVAGASSKTGLNGGKFVYKVIDSRGCIRTDSALMDTIYPLSITKNVKNASCSVSNGFIKVTAKGGNAPYTYTWAHTTPTDSVSGLANGKYYLTIIDSKGCVLKDTTTIAQIGVPVISFSSIPSRCRNSNGSITATVTNISSSISYIWSGAGETSPSISGKGPGSYTLTITDVTACSIASTFQLISIGVDSITMIAVQPKCDINNGTIKGVPSNIKGSHTYKWNYLAATTDSIGALGSGVYTLTVTDSVCTYVKSQTLVMQRKPDISLTKTNASCGLNNGKIISTVAFGTGTINYFWTPTGSTATTLNNLDTGGHTLFVTDAIGCKDTATINITRVPIIRAIFNVTKDTCKRKTGAVSTSVSGGISPYSYTWSIGSSTPSISGRYAEVDTLIITDNGTCTITSIVTIGEFVKPDPDYIAVPALCGKDNGSVKVFLKPGTGTPGFKYRWNTGATTDSLDNLAAGYYYVTITDTVGCIAYDTVTIDPGATPPVSISSINSTCQLPNGSITAAMPRGVNPVFKWSTGYVGPVLSNIGAGTYYLTVTDDRQCVVYHTIVITTTTRPAITISSTNSFCLGANGTISLSIANGTAPFSYLWNTGATTDNLNRVLSGKYLVTVTDAIGCVDSANTIVLETPNTLKASGTPIHLRCYNDASGGISISVSGGTAPYEYKTSTTNYIPTNFITGLSAGKQVYTVRDINGCLHSDSLSLTEPTIIRFDSSKKVDLVCYGKPTGEGEVFVSGGTPPYQYYKWTPKPVFGRKVVGMLAGVYTVEVSDANNCLRDTQVTINQPNMLGGDTLLKSNSCFGESKGAIEVNGFGGKPPYRYKWDMGSSSNKLSNLKQGLYKVTITDTSNCVATVTIDLKDPPILTFARNPTIIPARCLEFNEGEIEMYGSGGVSPYKYSIDSGKTFVRKNKFKNLLAGLYHMVIVDAEGCMEYKFDSVGGPPQFKIQAIPRDTTIQLGESVMLDYTVIAGNPAWSEGERWSDKKGLSCVDCKTPIAIPYAPEWYEIQVKYFEGRCTARDTAFIKIIDDNDVYIPSAFAPSSNYVDPILNVSNRTFMVYGNTILKAELRVFNRWGELMFHSKEANRIGWDGNYKGEPARLEVYTYYAEITFLSKRKRSYKGSVTLMR